MVACAALALPIAGCAAKEPAAYVKREAVTLLIPGGTDYESRQQSNRYIADLLRKRATEEARDPEYKPQVGSYAIYPADSSRPWIVIGAVTPRKGVFYARPYGDYATLDDYNQGRIEQRNGKINVCRMEIQWDRLPDGPVAPGMIWVGMYMSGVDCKPPPTEQLAMLDEWKARKAKPDYVIEGKASDGRVNVLLIREIPPKAWAYRPFDAVAASTKVIEMGDNVVWAIPLIDEVQTASVVATRRGRLLLYYFDKFSARDFHDMMCVADGLSWAEVAADPYALGTQATQRMCRDLTAQHSDRRNEEMRRRFDKEPPVVQSIPMTPRN
ncbi:protein of unknown function [uncultured Sphingopyxis sp.]|uniref:Uncharacterized protein n=1 Tax=uncultured Sphingopyxis sp. TaxID=310581 RepID=A0A1Y5PSJ4_9SPHN|nr:protein of unknown function [uncultured Sphingopyxis sp.]